MKGRARGKGRSRLPCSGCRHLPLLLLFLLLLGFFRWGPEGVWGLEVRYRGTQVVGERGSGEEGLSLGLAPPPGPGPGQEARPDRGNDGERRSRRRERAPWRAEGAVVVATPGVLVVVAMGVQEPLQPLHGVGQQDQGPLACPPGPWRAGGTGGGGGGGGGGERVQVSGGPGPGEAPLGAPGPPQGSVGGPTRRWGAGPRPLGSDRSHGHSKRGLIKTSQDLGESFFHIHWNEYQITFLYTSCQSTCKITHKNTQKQT